MPRVRRHVVVLALVAVVAALGASQPFASTTIVVSQVYGGGGNTGATLTHDYIERG